MDKNAKKAALWGGISTSAAIEAAPSRHSGRLHCVWAHAGVIRPRERGRDWRKKWVDGEAVLSVETEDEFWKVATTGEPVELTQELATPEGGAF